MIRPCETFSNYLEEPNQNTPQPFDSSDDYVFADVNDDTHVQYSTIEYKPETQKYQYIALSEKIDSEYAEESDEESDEDSVEESDKEINKKPESGSMDVIAVKQFVQSKMDLPNQIYFGSLTILGLYILYRLMRK
jgi:hypothetical protein